MSGQQSDAVPDVILAVLWLGTKLFHKRSVTAFQNVCMVYLGVPGTVPRQS